MGKYKGKLHFGRVKKKSLKNTVIVWKGTMARKKRGWLFHQKSSGKHHDSVTSPVVWHLCPSLAHCLLVIRLRLALNNRIYKWSRVCGVGGMHLSRKKDALPWTYNQVFLTSAFFWSLIKLISAHPARSQSSSFVVFHPGQPKSRWIILLCLFSGCMCVS